MSYHLARLMVVLLVSIPASLLMRRVVEVEGFWDGFLVGFVAFMFTDIWYMLCEARSERS